MIIDDLQPIIATMTSTFKPTDVKTAAYQAGLELPIVWATPINRALRVMVEDGRVKQIRKGTPRGPGVYEVVGGEG